MKLIINMDTDTIKYYANFYAGQYRSSKQEAGENIQKNVILYTLKFKSIIKF